MSVEENSCGQTIHSSNSAKRKRASIPDSEDSLPVAPEDFREEKAKTRELQMARAGIRGELQTCGCCNDSEVQSEDMLSCPDGHLFCRDCIRRSAEVSVGDGKTRFPCLAENCSTEFTIPVLQQVASSDLFSSILRRMQEEEPRQADKPDLVNCPFCSSSTTMPNPDDKLFRCLNPECLKESCRLCKEPNHIPQPWKEEVESSEETKMRVFIEARMTEAMLRKCWKCSRKFYKAEGCNKITCVCGAMMCYICRQPIDGYAHFDGGQCQNDTDESLLHRQDVENAAKEARNEFIREHPEAGSLQLKNDPAKILPEVKKPGTTVENLRGRLHVNPYRFRAYCEEDAAIDEEQHDCYCDNDAQLELL